MKMSAMKLKKTLIYLFLAVFTFVQIFPFYWLVTFSFKSNTEIFDSNNLVGLPKVWHFGNYSKAQRPCCLCAYYTGQTQKKQLAEMTNRIGVCLDVLGKMLVLGDGAIQPSMRPNKINRAANPAWGRQARYCLKRVLRSFGFCGTAQQWLQCPAG